MTQINKKQRINKWHIKLCIGGKKLVALALIDFVIELVIGNLDYIVVGIVGIFLGVIFGFAILLWLFKKLFMGVVGLPSRIFGVFFGRKGA